MIYNKSLDRTNDLVFKTIYGDDNNKDILANLLESILNLPTESFKDLIIVNPESRLDQFGNKTAIFDVKLHLNNETIIDIEIQVANAPELKNRIVYYNAKMITGQLKRGDSYFDLKKSVSIIIADFKLINDNNDYHNIYQLYNPENNSKFTDIIEFHILELPKLPKNSDDTMLWNWLKFLQTDNEEELIMLAEKSKELNKAYQQLRQISAEEVAIARQDSIDKARWDQWSREKGDRERAEMDFRLKEKSLELNEKSLELNEKSLELKEESRKLEERVLAMENYFRQKEGEFKEIGESLQIKEEFSNPYQTIFQLNQKIH